MTRLIKWIKSSFSGGNDGGDCVRVTKIGGAIWVRDETNAYTVFTRPEWEVFILGAKAGEFDYDKLKEQG